MIPRGNTIMLGVLDGYFRDEENGVCIEVTNTSGKPISVTYIIEEV